MSEKPESIIKYEIEELMTSVRADKEHFVHCVFQPMLLSLDKSLERVEYVYNRTEEYVRLTYKSGYVRDIEVSGGSELQIARDVLQTL